MFNWYKKLFHKAFCACGWSKRFPTIEEAEDALSLHFDNHPDEDLPIGGGCW